MIAKKKFREWLEEIQETDRPEKGTLAFNFGIFESTEGYMVYLVGNKTYHKEDSEWAVDPDYMPDPDLKYFLIAQTWIGDMDWKYVLRFVKELVVDFLNSKDSAGSFLAQAEYITAGFDGGDLEQIL